MGVNQATQGNIHFCKWYGLHTGYKKRIVLIPREDIISAWEKDYTDMKDDMIFGDKPTFDELIDMMKTLQEKFRKIQ